MNAFSFALVLLLASPVAANSRGNLRGQLDASCKDFNAAHDKYGDICHNLRFYYSKSRATEWCNSHGNIAIVGDIPPFNSANFRCCSCGGGDTFTDNLIHAQGVVQLPSYEKELNTKLSVDHFGSVSGTVKGLVKVKDGAVTSLEMGPVFLGAVEVDSSGNFVIPLKISGVSAACTANIEIRSQFCFETPWGSKECPFPGNFDTTAMVPLKDGSLDMTLKGVVKQVNGKLKMIDGPTVGTCTTSINVDEGGVKIADYDWSNVVVANDLIASGTLNLLIASGAQKAEDAAREHISNAVKTFVENTDQIRKFLEEHINSQSISSA